MKNGEGGGGRHNRDTDLAGPRVLVTARDDSCQRPGDVRVTSRQGSLIALVSITRRTSELSTFRGWRRLIKIIFFFKKKSIIKTGGGCHVRAYPPPTPPIPPPQLLD